MNFRYVLLLAAVAAYSPNLSFADAVQVGPASNQSVNGITLDQSLTIQSGALSENMALIAAGLRSKKVAGMFNVKVYVAEVLGTQASSFVKSASGATASLVAMNGWAIRLTFVRTVDAGTVQSSFQEALTANGYDLTDKDLTAFLKLVSDGEDANSGTTMTISVLKGTAGQVVVYQDSSGAIKSFTASTDISTKIANIWFGTPADSGLANLQSDLLNF